jgi:hypothetical protein
MHADNASEESYTQDRPQRERLSLLHRSMRGRDQGKLSTEIPIGAVVTAS